MESGILTGIKEKKRLLDMQLKCRHGNRDAYDIGYNLTLKELLHIILQHHESIKDWR